MVAVRGKHGEVAELLLKHKADPDKAGAGDMTPLHYAAQRGDKNMVDLLIRYKAGINPRNCELYTPLDLALINKHKDIAVILRKNGGVK